jgi:TetR/AcrR family tetracycline transcriptional repressor
VQARLSRDIFVETAFALADDEGLESLTIRRMAESHGVTPMALYRYFADKDRILDALAEALLAEVALPEPDERRWDEQAKELLTALAAALRRHPNAAILVLNRILQSEPGLALIDRTLMLLKAAGFPTDAAAETAGYALSSVVTLVVTEPGRAISGDVETHAAVLRVKKATLSSLDPRRYSHVVAAAAPLTRCASTEAYYDRGIHMIMSGIRDSQTFVKRRARRPSKAASTKAVAKPRRSRTTRLR